MPRKIDPAHRERAVRFVPNHRAECPTMSTVIAAVARQEGVGSKSLRRWVVQAEVEIK